MNVGKILENSFLYRTPLMAASGFLTKPAENNYEENHFSLEFFSEISQKLFLVFAAAFLKITPLQVFSQFLSFFEHVRGVSRTQSNIKTEPIAKIVDGSRGVFRTKWNI